MQNERGVFSVPRSAQKSIPIKRIYKDGIFELGGTAASGKGNGKFSKCWGFTDINYSVASYDAQMEMFLAWCGTLNAFSTDASYKITLNNHRLDREAFKRNLLMPMQGDELDEYRKENNDITLEMSESGNGLVKAKYVTVSVSKKTVEEARTFFTRIDNDLTANFAKLASQIIALSNQERLQIFHDFYRIGEESQFNFDTKALMQKGHDFKDLICPDNIQFKSGHFEMGEKFGRVLFLKDYASYIKDNMITEITDFGRNLMLSIDVLSVPTDEAVKEMQNRILAIETDITRWQRKQNDNNNFSAVIPYDLEQMRAEAKEFLDDLTTRDQRMLFVLVTMVHVADSLEELDADTEAIMSVGRKHLCNFATLKYQQEDALNTVLPFGLRKIETVRTMTTESTAVLIPFSAQEIQDSGGVLYGVNPITGNLIICNRKSLLNGNGFITGVSGSGKSFFAKHEFEQILLSTNDDILICDAEREYGSLVRALGGEVCHISAVSKNHINALDMHRDCGDGENPVTLKSEFVMSLCEQLMGGKNMGAKEKSIIDRCVSNIYRAYMANTTNKPPTLPDLRAELLQQPEPEAKDVALAIELFTDGSLNIFAKETNVNMSNRIISFDILDLGKQLKTVGMLVMLDAIMNRVIENRKKGKRTWIYIDEVHLYFANEYSSNFLSESWKRFRKYGALPTAMTQNIENCLESVLARTMLANSEFLIMLNQAPTDRAELAKLLNISDTQMSYITNADVGRGLIKVGGSLVPFVNEFPKDTKLYNLMTTKPGEGDKL